MGSLIVLFHANQKMQDPSKSKTNPFSLFDFFDFFGKSKGVLCLRNQRLELKSFDCFVCLIVSVKNQRGSH